jgi:predicted RNA binding protein YcfA (HicA-like mRNA interferase family)
MARAPQDEVRSSVGRPIGLTGVRLLFLTFQAGISVGRDSRDIIRELEADGWRFVGATGSHHHFKHPVKPGKVTIPHPRRDLHPKTLRSIYRQAGLKEPR